MTDEQIAIKVQQGDKELFGVLIERYEEMITRYARKFLFSYQGIEDVVQEVFIKVYTNIQSYNPQKPFSPWIYRIAHNEFINAGRKKKREPLSFFDFDADTIFPHPRSKDNADKHALEKEVKEEVWGCLDELDKKYREPIILYYFEDLSYKEIAEVLHVPSSTVGVRIARGRTMLKTAYSKKYEPQTTA
jgi:RNA polymerase sigma-70 factor (ECF subfamily)